jgi:hypothetical protein
MSLFSPYVGIVTRATPSDRSPVEEFYFNWLVGAALFFVVLEIAYLTFAGLPPIGKPWVDATNFVYGRDFLNTWMGGRSMFWRYCATAPTTPCVTIGSCSRSGRCR